MIYIGTMLFLLAIAGITFLVSAIWTVPKTIIVPNDGGIIPVLGESLLGALE